MNGAMHIRAAEKLLRAAEEANDALNVGAGVDVTAATLHDATMRTIALARAHAAVAGVLAHHDVLWRNGVATPAEVDE